MNNKIFTFQKMMICVIFAIGLLLSACRSKPDLLTSNQPTSTPGMESMGQITNEPERKPTEINTPTQTPLPTPTLQPVIVFSEELVIPECIPDQNKETLAFDEALDNTIPSLYEMESFIYKLEYSYQVDGTFPDEQLAVQLMGIHNGLLNSPADQKQIDYLPFTLVSQLYKQSHVSMVNLHNGMSEEAIITGDEVWYRPANELSWISISPANRSNLVNLSETFAPQAVVYMLNGGGLAPGVRTDSPDMVKQEVVNGVDTTHRCWIAPDMDEDFNAYLIHYESLYTFLDDAQVHLWTAEDDTQLVRLVLTGKNIGWRFFDSEFVEYDPPHDFFLWLDITNINQSVEIIPPDPELIYQGRIQNDNNPDSSSDFYRDELPLPDNSQPIDKNKSLIYISNVPPDLISREYLVGNFELFSGLLNYYLGDSWYTTEERMPVYETSQSLTDVLLFYRNAMKQNGWTETNQILQIGDTRYFLFFERGDIIVPIIIEPSRKGATLVQAILPPKEEMIDILQEGWQSNVVKNSGLASYDVTAISFDSLGQVWLSTRGSGGYQVYGSDGSVGAIPEKDGGIYIYKGDEWVPFDPKNSEIDLTIVQSIAFDELDRLWISTPKGVSRFDGNTWRTFTSEDFQLDGVFNQVQTHNNIVWVSNEDGISYYDNNRWHPAQFLHEINSFTLDISGIPWVGTNGGGIYSYENNEWIEHVAHDTNSIDGIEALHFDSLGNLWIISSEDGVGIFDGDKWQYFNAEDAGQEFNTVGGLLTLDQLNRVWLVNFSGRVFMLENGEWADYTPLYKDASIYAPNTIVVDLQGRVWIGSDHGIAVFTPPSY